MQAPHAKHQVQDIKLKKAYVELLEFQIEIPLCFFKIFKGSGVKVPLFWFFFANYDLKSDSDDWTIIMDSN